MSMHKQFGFRFLMIAGLAAGMLIAPMNDSAGEAGGKAPFADRDWQSPHFQDHTLAGVIWSPSKQERLTLEAYRAKIRSANLVLLGEIHTNPDHHLLQAEALSHVVESGRMPAVVFEMISLDLADTLDTVLTENPKDWQGLGAALSWEARGWPDWNIYAPIARVALENGLSIVPGDLPREDIRAIGRGPDALPEDLSAIVSAARPLSETSRASLDDELFRSHCELVPRDAITPMRRVQMGRDAALTVSLAQSIAEVGRDNGAVLIAGAGHARRDWGVPWHLAERLPDVSVLSVAFIEVAEGKDTAADYLPAADSGESIYDIVVFTPRADITDHCAGLRERFKSTERASE